MLYYYDYYHNHKLVITYLIEYLPGQIYEDHLQVRCSHSPPSSTPPEPWGSQTPHTETPHCCPSRSPGYVVELLWQELNMKRKKNKYRRCSETTSSQWGSKSHSCPSGSCSCLEAINLLLKASGKITGPRNFQIPKYRQLKVCGGEHLEDNT